MPELGEEVRKYRCPLCLAKDLDPAMLRFDGDRERYYCTICCFTGTPAEIEAVYAQITARYKLLTTRLAPKVLPPG